MNAAWAAVATAGVGAIAALAGAAIGPLISSHRESRQWVRGKRADRLESLVAAVEGGTQSAYRYLVLTRYRNEAIQNGAQDLDAVDEELGQRRGELIELVETSNGLIGTSEIYSSKRLVDQLRSFRDQVHNLALELIADSDPSLSIDRLREIRDRIVDEVRHELGVP